MDIRWIRTLPALAVATAFAAALAAAAGATGKPSYGCGTGFTYHVTIEEATELPRSVAAVEDGLITPEDLIASYQAIDVNGNGSFCAKEVPGFEEGRSNRQFAEYFYEFNDDNASIP
jgi:hypothetical protein